MPDEFPGYSNQISNHELRIIHLEKSLGDYFHSDTNNRIPLSDIVTRAGSIFNFNLAIYPDKVMNGECKTILNEIEGFEYKICGRELIWTLGCLNGTCQWTESLENAIINNKPTTKS